MTPLEWIFIGILIFTYLLCLVTLCIVTFTKGYIALGILGIFFPLLWFIGAVIPPKRGSRYERAESAGMQQRLPPMPG